MVTIVEPKIEYLVIVPGRARSFRSHYAKEYRDRVREAAQKVITEMFHTNDIDLKIDYFYRGNRNVDMDNITKNVMDALTNIAYPDDRLVKTQNSRAHKVDEIVYIKREVFDIFKPLANYEEYLTIRIRSRDAYIQKGDKVL